MPGMNGLDTRDEILEIKEDAFVILMSGFNEHVTGTRRRDSGEIFLRKPFSSRELMAHLNVACSSR